MLASTCSIRPVTLAFFGASVTYATERGNVKTITIVGIDEADLSRGAPKAATLVTTPSRTAAFRRAGLAPKTPGRQ